MFLSDGSTATIRNSTLDSNAVVVDTPLGQAFGADAALCACGDVPLTIRTRRIDSNTLTVNTLSSDANGPAAGSVRGRRERDDHRHPDRWQHDDRHRPDQGRGRVGAVGFFFGGTVTPTLTDSQVIDNRSIANAPEGAATVQGAGITNNGPLVLSDDRVSGNTGSANGQSGFAQGGGIWNGLLFGGPTLRSPSRTPW